MTARIYRVQATGQFADLTPALKHRLLDEQMDHDVLISAFTPRGRSPTRRP